MTTLLPRRARIVSPTSIVQLEYSPHPLPKPEPTGPRAWTRFVLLSDTHAHTFPVPDGDVLLHSGDLTRRGTFRDLRRTLDWLCALPHPIKIIIAGNRDFSLDREWYDANWEQTGSADKVATWEPPDPISELLTGPRAVAAHIVYLRDQEYKFQVRPGGREWTVYGSPQSPNFGARVRAFGYDAADAEAIVSSFPTTDILLTHGPPHGVLDRTTKATLAGCPALAARLAALRPRLHVFGHIHEARGAYVHLWEGAARPSAQVVDAADEAVAAGAQTVFVNAATFPAGPNAPRTGVGGPVVVDLLE
ncbi:Metallo-dependent phosphatase-like protein [Mycena belliarum]|uniref:Metallo-dependent phosphatase-like protein n=1 Tax=Mycena belliarum TaxID=1033014 RepID=A0AAD6U3E5_9AGAR|nr:Metallo-dependent phosphatase-like protein [Mycena belliae]